jgi:beta-lactamase regulating signal transducer with metallopeptidase domain
MDVIDVFFHWLWTTSLCSSVLILLVLLLQAALKKHLTARWSYALGLLAVLRLWMPVTPEAGLSLFSMVPSFPEPAMEAMTPEAHPVSVSPTSFGDSAAGFSASRIPAGRGSPEDADSPAPVMLSILQLIWMLGFGWVFGRAILQHLSLGRWLDRNEPLRDTRICGILKRCQEELDVRREVRVITVPRLRTAALFGWLRPWILLPEETLGELSDKELRFILLHELMHLKSGDAAMNWGLIFLRALHWPNPIVAFLLCRVQADREMVRDAAVLARLSPGERIPYGQTLIKLLNTFTRIKLAPSLVPVMTNKNEIKRRITMISTNPMNNPWKHLLCAVMIGTLGIVTFTSSKAEDEENGNKEKRERREHKQAGDRKEHIARAREYIAGLVQLGHIMPRRKRN